MTMVGDGFLSLADPKRHCGLWEVGPQPLQDVVKEFEERPLVTRIAGAVMIVLGLVLAEQLRPETKHGFLEKAREAAGQVKKTVADLKP